MTPLSPRVIQSVGLCLCVGAFVFWMVTGKQSSLLVAASITLVTLGGLDKLYAGFLKASRDLGREAEDEKPKPLPPADEDS